METTATGRAGRPAKPVRQQVCYMAPPLRLEYWLDALHGILPEHFKMREYSGAFGANQSSRAQLLENVHLCLIDLTNLYNERKGSQTIIYRPKEEESVFVLWTEPSQYFCHILTRLRTVLDLPICPPEDTCEAAHIRLLGLMFHLQMPKPANVYPPGPERGQEDWSLVVQRTCAALYCGIHRPRITPSTDVSTRPPPASIVGSRLPPAAPGYVVNYNNHTVGLPFPAEPRSSARTDTSVRLPSVIHMEYFAYIGAHERAGERWREASQR
ncbi:hypothetical protein C8F01DRAFT_1351530 [Mycena amicta]|nr:hypothetical protein C8F01DRAFT_1351530 [Mycena amicta]